MWLILNSPTPKRVARKTFYQIPKGKKNAQKINMEIIEIILVANRSLSKLE